MSCHFDEAINILNEYFEFEGKKFEEFLGEPFYELLKYACFYGCISDDSSFIKTEEEEKEEFYREGSGKYYDYDMYKSLNEKKYDDLDDVESSIKEEVISEMYGYINDTPLEEILERTKLDFLMLFIFHSDMSQDKTEEILDMSLISDEKTKKNVFSAIEKCDISAAEIISRDTSGFDHLKIFIDFINSNGLMGGFLQSEMNKMIINSLGGYRNEMRKHYDDYDFEDNFNSALSKSNMDAIEYYINRCDKLNIATSIDAGELLEYYKK